MEETKRNYMYMKLYNYNVDGIFINRILPREIDNPFFAEWITIQKKYIAEIETCFDPIPKYYIPWYDTDLLGQAAINRICDDVFATRPDLFAIKADIEGESYEQTEAGYKLKLFLPNISKDEVGVNLAGSDVIVKIGNYNAISPCPTPSGGWKLPAQALTRALW